MVAVAADAACEVLEEAHARDIAAAIVLAAGFGEGGHGEARAARLRSLADKGMCICGPNCFGLVNVKTGMAVTYSGPLARPLRPGPVAIVSQSGGLGANVFAPLMTDRELGFSHLVSCGNQVGATIEDYVEYFVDNPDVTVIAAVIEQLKNPRKLVRAARLAHARRKSIVLFQAGRSEAGRIMVQSHTGALAGNAEILAASCAVAPSCRSVAMTSSSRPSSCSRSLPRDPQVGREIVVISGSGGGAAVAADALNDAGAPLATFDSRTCARIDAVMPEFGSVTNPIDGTGAIYDDPALLPKILDAILTDPGRPILAASVSARGAGNEQMRGFARTFADQARASGRTVVAYQYSPLGGPLELRHRPDAAFRAGSAPAGHMECDGSSEVSADPARLSGRAPKRPTSMIVRATGSGPMRGVLGDADRSDFLTARAALVAAGVPIVDARLARSEEEAVAHLRHFGTAVAVEAPDVGQIEHRLAAHDPDARGRDEVCDRHRPNEILLAHLVDGEHERDERAGNRGGASAPVRLDDVAIERDRSLSKVLHPRHGAQRPADQALNLLRTPANFSGRGLTLRPGGRCPRQHAVLGCDPPLAGVSPERRDPVLDAGRADHFRLSRFDQHRAFGVNQVVRGDAGRAELFRKAAV